MHRLIAIVLLWCCSYAADAQKTQTIYFESGRSIISQKQQTQLKQVLTASSHWERIVVEGYTDSVGTEVYNLRLSQQRAESVRSFLISQGLPSGVVECTYFGETKTQQGNLAENRQTRVQFYSSQPVTQLSPLYEQLRSTQKFYIDPNRDTLIRCAEGSLIHIKANTFAVKGNPGTVLFEVREVFKKSDMILENLSTTSDGRILETRGMIYTNAMQGDDTLAMTKAMTIMMPTQDYTPAAGVFDGARDPHSDAMNWTVNNNSVLRNFSVTDFTNCQEYADYLDRLESQGVDPYRKGLLNCERVLMDSLRRCLWECGTQSELRCRLFFCQFRRGWTALGSLFSRRKRLMRSWEKQERRNAKRLMKLHEKGEDLTIDDVREIQQLLKTQDSTSTNSLTEKEKQLLELTNLIETTDSLAKTETVEMDFGPNCKEIKELMAEYGVTNTEELTLAINRPLLDEFGVTTMEELLDTLPKSNFGNLEAAYASKNISYSDFKFYVFNSSTLGWKNLDIFAKIPKKDQVTLKVDLVPGPEVDCKLVFKEREFVLPGKLADGYFYFEGMPRNEEAWLVAIKYENKTPYLALLPVRVKQTTVKLEFREKTLEQLRANLEVLDFR